MDKSMTNISRNVRSGKILVDNISPLFNYMANQYHDYAGVRLVMHYYTFYESYLDDGDTWSDEAKEIMTQINNVIEKNILSNHKENEMEKTIRFVDELRSSIMKRMKLLTAYTDIFQIYEYILNRVEYRFKDELITLEDEEFAKEVLRYIFDTQDNMIINEKIKEIVGQLPIRMTKQKYFELLKESIRLYQGADQDTLDKFLYMLRTSAMLYPKEDMITYYPKLWEQKASLDMINYKEINNSDFIEAESILKQATLFLERETSVYYSLQEIINEVYAILLCEPYVGVTGSKPENKEEIINTILRSINDAFLNNNKNEFFIELMEKFSEIEGVQEELSYDLANLEDALYEVDKNHRELVESMMMDKLLNVLLRTKDLLSNSLFIDWNEENNINKVTEEVVKNEATQLEGELTALFAEQDRVVARAVMANTLSKIPVFFQDHKEVMEYVRYSIERCTDLYEKTACVEIIRDIMSE